MNDQEATLLAQILAEIEQITVSQHELAKRKRILVEAATRLRLGQSASAVLAQIERAQDRAEAMREVRRSA
jgi:hypothetical protein